MTVPATLVLLFGQSCPAQVSQRQIKLGDQQIKTAVVPVAGLGTRLLPLTKSLPKEMLPVGRFPCIEHVVRELMEVGIERVVFVSSSGKESIAQHFSVNVELDSRLRAVGKTELADEISEAPVFSKLQVETVLQAQQLGLGHAVLQAKEAIGNESFILALGDSIITRNGHAKIPSLLSRMVRAHCEGNSRLTIAFQTVDDESVSKYGIAEPASEPVDGVFSLGGLVEKPSLVNAPSRYAITARYILGPDIFPAIESTSAGVGGEIQLTDAMKMIIDAGNSAFGVCLNARESRVDVGSISGYYKAFIDMALQDPDFGDEVNTYLTDRICTSKSDILKEK